MEFLSRHKKAFISVVIFISLVIIIITIRPNYKPTFIENILGSIITPVQKYVEGIGDWFKEKITFISSINEIQAENIRLKEELENFNSLQTRYELIRKDNENLSKLFEIDQKYAEHPKIGAEVIGKDLGNWYNTFVIDKGTVDKLEKNMVVLASGGLVGVITQSYYNYSKVTPLIHVSSSIGAKSLRTDDIGLIRGDSTLMQQGLCKMEYIDINSKIIEGDEIVTSNLGEIYPPGITIGHVQEIKTDSKGLTKYAIIKPTVDFKHLETVLVINKKVKIKISSNLEE